MDKGWTILVFLFLHAAAAAQSPASAGPDARASRASDAGPGFRYQWEVNVLSATLPEGGIVGAETVQGVRLSDRFYAGAGLGVYALLRGRDRAWPTTAGLRPALDLRPYLSLRPRSEVYLDVQMGALCPLAEDSDVYLAIDVGLGVRAGFFNAAVCLATLDFSSAGVMLKAGISF